MIKTKSNVNNELDHRIGTEHNGLTHPPIGDSQAQHKRILAVDDNSDIAFTLRTSLENG